jgi:hypothetical protein
MDEDVPECKEVGRVAIPSHEDSQATIGRLFYGYSLAPGKFFACHPVLERDGE